MAMRDGALKPEEPGSLMPEVLADAGTFYGETTGFLLSLPLVLSVVTEA